MQVWDAECAARVAKHRAMRAQKQFDTVECPLHLDRCLPAAGHRAAGRFGQPGRQRAVPSRRAAGENAAEANFGGVEAIAAQCENLILVSNEVFSGGARLCRETDLYLQALAMVNNAVAARADAVCRVVCGPVYYKGGESP